MDPSEATLEREQCSLHPDRGAVGVCERCERTVCLECAVAFRGTVRCERCAALELGDPEPVTTPSRRLLRPEHGVLALLVTGLAATFPPWHRSGTLTSVLSAWRVPLDGWAALGCIALAAAAALMLPTLLRPSAGTRKRVAVLALSALSAFAIGIALVRAPGFFSSTAAPYIAGAAGFGAGAVTASSLVRRPRP